MAGQVFITKAVGIVELMLSNSESLKLDLTARNNNGITGFQRAQDYRKTDVVPFL